MALDPPINADKETRMKRAFRRPLAGLAIVGAVALIAGCGGGSDDRLSLDDFRTQADAVCADANRLTDAIEAPTSNDGVLPALEATQAATDPSIEKLKDITPPEDLQSKWDEAITLQEQQSAALQSAIDRIKAGEDPSAVLNELGSEATSRRDRLRALAGELGLTVCGAEDDDTTTTTTTTDTAPTTASTPTETTPSTVSTETTVSIPTTGDASVDQYVKDAQEAAGALTAFGTLLQGVTSVDDLKSKAPEAQESLDDFDAAIAKLDGYTLDNATLEKQRAGLVEEGPKVSDVLRRFVDAASSGDMSAVQALLPEVMTALQNFSSAATDVS